MSARTRGRAHPRPIRWEDDAGLGPHDAKMRRLALSRPECHECGGIPRERPVRVVKTVGRRRVYSWYLCGPCTEKLESGQLLKEQGVC